MAVPPPLAPRADAASHAPEARDCVRRFEGVRARLAEAVADAGREPGSVSLVAVSKNHPAEAVAALAVPWRALGEPLFGESYVQEALPKMDRVRSLVPGCPMGWHFVGHIQSRKARHLVGRFDLLHSVDSVKLARALARAWLSEVASAPVGLAAPAPEPQAILVQVNVGREPQKSGVDPDGLEELLTQIMTMPELSLKGLMCLPPLAEIGERSRPYFAFLRQCRDAMEGRLGIRLPHLSMGMSDDFEAAVAEGATLVRIGTDIFGPRNS